MYFLGIVQSILNQGRSVSTSVFSLDVLIFCIVLATGCATFVDNTMSMENRLQWIDKFPEALWLLSERSNWAEHMPRVSLCKVYSFRNTENNLLSKKTQFILFSFPDFRVFVSFEHTTIPFTQRVFVYD